MSSTTISSNPAQATYGSLNVSRDKTVSANDISDAQSRFLKLLTTQLKNQDPLNPMDNAQMTSQMAQISTVDGIERLNKSLQTLLDSSSESQSLQASLLIGRTVLVQGSDIALTQGVGVAAFDLAEPVDRATVSILDGSGRTVRSMDIGSLKTGRHELVWDGKSDNGTPVVEGNYRYKVEAYRSGQKVDVTALMAAVVESVSRTGGDVTLGLGQAGSATMADIKEIL